jgi:hypothetical protein
VREWTPRILDFSWGHWILTALFTLAAFSCFRAARSRKNKPVVDAPTNLWPIASWVAVFHAVNLQLDFDELLRESGRIFAILVGVSPVRHLVTGAALVGLILLVGGAILSKGRAGASRREILTIVALLVPTAWFVLSTISNHHLGMLLDEFTWDTLTVISLAVVIGASQWQVRSVRA